MIWNTKDILVIGWKGGGVNWKTKSAPSLHIAIFNSDFYDLSQNIITCECITTLILLGHYIADNFKLRMEEE